MKAAFAITGTLAVLLLASRAPAAPQAQDEAFETSTVATAIPDRPGGSVTVHACSSCPPKLVRLTAQSTYRVGRHPVTFEQLREHVRASGPLYLTVVYEPRKGSVTLLAVSSGSKRQAR